MRVVLTLIKPRCLPGIIFPEIHRENTNLIVGGKKHSASPYKMCPQYFTYCFVCFPKDFLLKEFFTEKKVIKYILITVSSSQTPPRHFPSPPTSHAFILSLKIRKPNKQNRIKEKEKEKKDKEMFAYDYFSLLVVFRPKIL